MLAAALKRYDRVGLHSFGMSLPADVVLGDRYGPVCPLQSNPLAVDAVKGPLGGGRLLVLRVSCPRG